MRSEADGRRSSSTAASSDRDPTGAGLRHRVSISHVALLADAFGVHLCLGTVSQLEQEVSTALIAPTADARAYIRQQATVNMDETSWRERRTKAWLWTAVTAGVTVFAIRRHRAREVIDELLGHNNTAIVGSDRYSAYGHLPLSR